MADEHDFRSRVETAIRAFGVNCSKLAGAVTVEVSRTALLESGMSVSPHDVFIRGVPVEFDLLITAPNTAPTYGVVYNPVRRPPGLIRCRQFSCRSGSSARAPSGGPSSNSTSLQPHHSRRTPVTGPTIFRFIPGGHLCLLS